MTADIILRKNATIVYTTIVNFLVGIVLTRLLQKLLPRYDKSSGVLNYLKLIITIAATVLLHNVCSMISEHIPLPPAILGFDPNTLPEKKASILSGLYFSYWLGSNFKEFKPILEF